MRAIDFGFNKLDCEKPCASARLFSRSALRGQEALQDLRLALVQIESVVPSDALLILVDDNAFPPDGLPDRQVLPFPERDGRYGGRPEDDKSAVEELHRLRRLGASHMVFAWTAFWWLDWYTGLSRYVRGHFPCLLQNDRIMAFDLQRYAKEALLHAYMLKHLGA